MRLTLAQDKNSCKLIGKMISGLTLHSTLFDLTFYLLPLKSTNIHQKFTLLLAARKQNGFNSRVKIKSPEKILSVGSSNKNINLSIYNIICWVAWTMGQMNHRPSVWCSKYYFFHDFSQNSLQKSFYFFFLFFYKNKELCP